MVAVIHVNAMQCDQLGRKQDERNKAEYVIYGDEKSGYDSSSCHPVRVKFFLFVEQRDQYVGTEPAKINSLLIWEDIFGTRELIFPDK